MHTTARRARRWGGLALVLQFLSGCAGIGLQDILTGLPVGGDLRGEIEWIDTRDREIGLSRGWGGAETVRYDDRTRVIYGQRRYDIRDLERGDVVSIDIDQDARRRHYARTIRVERAGRDSGGRRGDVRRERYDGRVAWVDRDRGQFGLEMGRSEYVVTVPYRNGSDVSRRFERLRRGERARFEGAELNRGRIALYRFL